MYKYVRNGKRKVLQLADTNKYKLYKLFTVQDKY